MSKILIERVQNDIEYRNCCFIPLHPSGFAAVDSDDYYLLSQWHWKCQRSHSCFYAVRKMRINGKTIYIRMHREITMAQPGTEVHHKNYNTLDNRKCNLQVFENAKDHRAASSGLD